MPLRVSPSRTMLDPLSVLSFASNIITAVDFAGKVIKTTAELKRSRHGTLAINHEIEVVACNLESILDDLPVRASEPRSTEVEALETLADTCKELLRELLEVLEKLKIPKSGKKWQHARKVFAGLCSGSKIRDYTGRLNVLQSSLNTVLISVIM